MIRTLSRYIGVHVVGATVIVAVLIAGLVFLFSLVGELGNIGQGDYGLWQAIVYVMLTGPLQFYQLFPMVSLVGSLLALGMLASRSELTVMRAAGYSIGKITRDVMAWGTVLLLFMTVLGEIVVPQALQYANIYKANQINGGQAIQTENGVWLRDRDNFVHITTVLPHKVMFGLTRYEFDDNKNLIEESYIQKAVYQDKKWELEGITKTAFTLQGLSTQYINAQDADFSIYPDLLSVSRSDPTTMLLPTLADYIAFQKKSAQPTAGDAYTFWQRVFQPFSNEVMMFLAVPFVFGSLRSVTIGLRTVFGIILGGGFYLLNKFLGPVSLVYQVPPILAASIPTLIFIGVGVYLMRQVK